jgi:hypothetical protein
LPLTISLSAGIWGPLLLANARAGCPPFFTCARHALLQLECEVHAGSFFLSFSFHSLTAAPPPSRVAPSSRVALVVCPLSHMLRRVAPFHTLPLHHASTSPHRPHRTVESFSFFLFYLLTLPSPFSPMSMTPVPTPLSRVASVASRICHVSPLSPRPAIATRCFCCAVLPPLHALPHPGALPSPCLALSPSLRNAAAPWCVFPSFPFPFPFADVPFLPLCLPL